MPDRATPHVRRVSGSSENHMPHPHKTRAQERADALDISPTKLLAEIEQLRGELDATRAQAEEYLAGLQRERAEFTNFRRRTAEERERDLGLAGEALIRKVLALADDFDRAIEARPSTLDEEPWVEGIAAIDRKLRVLLESEGVSVIDASPGRTFDPREHDAIANVPSPEHQEGAIVDEVRRGYLLRDRVLRPALVTVAASREGGPADRPPDPGRPPTTTNLTPEPDTDQ